MLPKGVCVGMFAEMQRSCGGTGLRCAAKKQNIAGNFRVLKRGYSS